jgi:hypothetical protein
MKVMLILALALAALVLAVPVDAKPESITMGPYKVNFDLGNVGSYTVNADTPQESETLGGIPYTANNVPAEKTDSTKNFVGSTNSKKYHYPSCGAAKNIHPENEIWFSSSEDARSHGYVPCKRCNPP